MYQRELARQAAEQKEQGLPNQETVSTISSISPPPSNDNNSPPDNQHMSNTIPNIPSHDANLLQQKRALKVPKFVIPKEVDQSEFSTYYLWKDSFKIFLQLQEVDGTLTQTPEERFAESLLQTRINPMHTFQHFKTQDLLARAYLKQALPYDLELKSAHLATMKESVARIDSR